MDWSLYHYLAIVALLALAVLAVAWKLLPTLSQASEKPRKAEVIILVLAMVVGLLAIYWNQYREMSSFSYTDLGADTRDQYVPYYLYLIDHVRSGTLSTWVFDYGLGTSLLNCQSWTFDPFNFVLIPLALLLGDAHLSLALVLTQSVKMLASGLLFDRLLSRFCQMPLSRILGSLLFSFGGYSVVWGQHYWLGSVLPLSVLALLAFEALAERRSIPRQLGVTAITFVCMAWSVYVGFMVLLFAAIYMLFRILSQTEELTPRTVITRIGRLLAPVVCGCLLACITLIPYMYYLMEESGRVSGGDASLLSRMGTSATSFVPLKWIPAALSRLLGTGLIDTGASSVSSSLIPSAGGLDLGGSFTYEYLMLGFSSVTVILLFQFYSWALSDARKRDRKLILAATVIIVLYCINLFLPTFFNAMVNLRYRSSFALAFPICIALSIGWEQRIMTGKLALGPFIASLVVTLAILAWSLRVTINGRLVCLFYIASVVLSALLLVIFYRTPTARFLTILVLGAAFSSSIVDGFFTTNLRAINPIEVFPFSEASGTASDDTMSALAWVRNNDPDAYRLDKTYAIWSPLSDGLAGGYSGMSSYNSTLDTDVAEFYTQLWPEALLYDLQYVQGITIDETEGSHQMLELLGMRYILSMDPLAIDWLTLVHTEGRVYVYKATDEPSLVSAYLDTMSESDADALPDANARRQASRGSLIVPDSIAQGGTGDANTGGKPNIISDLRVDESKARLDGSITASTNAYVCLSIPHTAGWEVYVDGQPVETFRANYGFIGFKLSAGSHAITASYTPVGMHTAVAAALIGIAATAIMCGISRMSTFQDSRTRLS